MPIQIQNMYAEKRRFFIISFLQKNQFPENYFFELFQLFDKFIYGTIKPQLSSHSEVFFLI